MSLKKEIESVNQSLYQEVDMTELEERLENTITNNCTTQCNGKAMR